MNRQTLTTSSTKIKFQFRYLSLGLSMSRLFLFILFCLLTLNQACIDGFGDMGQDRVNNFRETIDLISLSLDQKGIPKKVSSAIRETLLEKAPVPKADEVADGRLLLVTAAEQLVEKKQPIALVTDLCAYLALRVAGLVEKQLAKTDKKISRTDLAVSYTNDMMAILMAQEGYSGTDLLSTLRIVYAGLKKSLGPEGEKNLLSQLSDNYIRALEATHPDEAKIFMKESSRDVLKRSLLGDVTIGDLLAKVMVGKEPATSLDKLIESLAPIDSILNGSPDARKELINQTVGSVFKSSQLETVQVEKERSDISKNSAGTLATKVLDPPKRVSIVPVNLYQGIKPKCSVDAMGNLVEYKWFVNRAAIESEIREELVTEISKGDVVRCEARFTDGKNKSDWVQSLANEVKNSKPVAGKATISSSTPSEPGYVNTLTYVVSTLTCLKSGFLDADGDELEHTVSWYVNGELVPGEVQNAFKNPAGGALIFKKGDKVTCSITASDGLASSDAAVSAEVTIVNSPPSFTGIGTFVTTVTIIDSINCQIAGQKDPDGDPLTIVYRWTKNNTQMSLNSNVSTLAGLFVKNDRIRCFAKVSDGVVESGERSSGEVLVVNTPPVFTGPVTLSPQNPTILNDLICSYTAGSDIDGDTLTYYYEWYVNDLPKASTTNKLLAADFKAEDKVVCRVYVSDGTVSNKFVESVAVYPTGFNKISRFGGEALDIRGSADGAYVYVAKGNAGLEIYSRNATTGILTLVSTLFLGGESKVVEVFGSYAYVLADSLQANVPDSMHIIDVANPASPVLVASYNSLQNPQGLTVAGNYAFVADGTSGFQVINVATKNAPAFVRTDKPEANGTYYDVKVSGNKLLLASALVGVHVLDLNAMPAGAQTAWPTVATMNTAGEARKLFVNGNRVFVADHYSGASEWNIDTYTLVSDVDTPGIAQDVFLIGTKLLIADGTSGMRVALTTGSPGLIYDSNYQSENLVSGVWAYGQNAYASDGANGILVLNISGTGTPPSLIQHIDGIGGAKSLVRSGNYLYVADGVNGVVVLDVTNGKAPNFVSSIAVPGNNTANLVAVRGSYLYLAADKGVYVYNISNPLSPTLASSISSLYDMQGLSFSGNYLFVGEAIQGFKVIDVTNPAAISAIGNVNTPGSVLDVLVVGNYLFVADGTSGLLVYDVSTPTNVASILLRGQYDTPGTARKITLNNNTLYLADTQGTAATTGGVLVFDVSASLNVALPTNAAPYTANNLSSTSPRLTYTLQITGKAYDVKYDAGYIYVACYDGGMQIINHTSTVPPVVQFTLDTDGLTYGLYRDSAKGEVYLADHTNGVVILGDPTP